jgi:hypothetical protein
MPDYDLDGLFQKAFERYAVEEKYGTTWVIPIADFDGFTNYEKAIFTEHFRRQSEFLMSP